MKTLVKNWVLVLATVGLAGGGAFPVHAAGGAAKDALEAVLANGAESSEEKHDKGGHGKGHGDGGHKKKGHGSQLTDEKIPLQLKTFPKRPKPLLELGEPFKGTGTLSPGLQLPTGAVWQPALVAFGTLRTAVQTNNVGNQRVSEAVGRLDLFANLQLSGSERMVIGFRNLDQDGRFTSRVFDSENPNIPEGSESELNADIQSLFFEGDFGEIFPNISPDDFKATDIGFALGRQPLFFQEGMLINDAIDGIGITRNTLLPKNTSNFRATLFYGWNNVTRGPGQRDTGKLLAVLTSTDFRRSTMDIDAAYVSGKDNFKDALAFGVSAVQRIGLINTSFRLLGSFESGGVGPDEDGLLFFSEISWTPHHTHDLVYVTSFIANDTYRAPAANLSVGGPLGRAGISFAPPGMGNYGAALSSAASDVVGGAIGTQIFLAHTRRQFIVELAGRVGTDQTVQDAYATTARYQAALGQRFVVVVDAFANYLENLDDTFFGGRLELQIRL